MSVSSRHDDETLAGRRARKVRLRLKLDPWSATEESEAQTTSPCCVKEERGKKKDKKKERQDEGKTKKERRKDREKERQKDRQRERKAHKERQRKPWNDKE